MGYQSAACCALWSLLFLAGTAWGQSRVRVVTVSAVGNQVQEKLPPPPGTSATVTAWAKASRNAPVIEGEGIRTEPNSFAEVELECGSALRLAPESEMEFTRLRLSREGVPDTTVKLSRGEAFFTMQNADVPDFYADLPGGTINMPKGGAVLRLDVPAVGMNSVEVLGGQISIQEGNKSEQVKTKRRVEFLPGGGIHLAAMLKADRWQKWSQQRDEAFHRQVITRETTTPPPTAPASPVQPGMGPSEPAIALAPILQAINDDFGRSGRPAGVPACAHR